MLEYDEWVVPGEVEYAEKKAEEIEMQIQKYQRDSLRNYWERNDWDFYVQITEHVIGKFRVTIPKQVWDMAIYDIDINNSMILDWFQDQVAPIDNPKIFDLPDDDVRSMLPEWNDFLLPDDSREDIMRQHSVRYMVIREIERLDGNYDWIKTEYHLNDAKCSSIMESFIKKLCIDDKPVAFTELEEKIGCSVKHFAGYGHYKYYQSWDFPLAMSGKDIIDVICEAYQNARKRSRRIFPNRIDCENLDRGFEVDCHPMKNYECLYQGRAGEMVIRFLFDYKNWKIVMAYPALRDSRLRSEYSEYEYYDKVGKYFTWGYFSI